MVLVYLLALSFYFNPILSGGELDQSTLIQSSRAINQIAKKATPTVVSITSVKESYEPLLLELPENSERSPSVGLGSGIIIRSDGIILTNHHLVQDARKVTVNFDEKAKTIATVLASDPKTDLAIIKVNSEKPLPTLSFGDSDQIQVGDWTMAIGNPFGLNHTITSGIVSAVGRGQLGMLDIEDFIQTDAAINPGNSGGPLLNSKGEMIGINTAIFSENGGFVGIGFAIPSKIAKQVTEDLIKYGRVIRGWIGVYAQDMDLDLADYFKAPSSGGALVTETTKNSPGSHILQVGDIVTQFGDHNITTAKELKSLVAKTAINSRVALRIRRRGVVQTVSIRITEQPNIARGLQRAGRVASKHSNQANQISQIRKPLGMVVQDLPEELARVFRLPIKSGAVIVDVQIGSPAFEAGLGRGDVILKVNNTEIKNEKDFRRAEPGIKSSSLSVLYIQRGMNEKLFVPLKPSA